MTRLLALSFALWAAAAAGACPERETFDTLELAYRVEKLSPDSPDWTDVELAGQRKLGPRRVLLGRVTRTARFDLLDTTGAAGLYWPLGARDTVFVEAAYSPTHRVMARGYGQASWNHSFDGGWGTEIGIKQAHYGSTDATLGSLTLEKYAGPFRVAYTYGPSYSTAAGSADGHKLQGGYFYGDFSSAQVVVARGTELDRPSPTGDVVAAEVSSLAAFGMQQVGCEWGVGWNLGYTENRGTPTGERYGGGIFLRRYF